MVEVVVTTGVIRRAKLQSVTTNKTTSSSHRPDAIHVSQPTVLDSEHRREKYNALVLLRLYSYHSQLAD